MTMIFDPTNLQVTIERYHPHPLPDGCIAWGQIRIAEPPLDGLLVRSKTGIFALLKNGCTIILDHDSVLTAIHDAIME